MTHNNSTIQDKEQRQLALDASQSFIVQAPAGSGKTELLIQRFLTLLNYVNHPEEVLAITFTKKAASEMRARVINALKQASTDPEPTSQHAKQTWQLARNVLERDQTFHWQLINNPNQLRIQTIDSLCTYLTKQLPLLSHFGSQPDIADNPSIFYRQAVQEVLSHVEENYAWSQAISELLIHLDNDLNKLYELLVNLLEKRDQWLPYIQLNTDNTVIKKQLEKYLACVITDSLATIKQLFSSALGEELVAIARYAADNLIRSEIESEIVACRELTHLPDTTIKAKTAWLGLAKLLLTKEFNWRKKADKNIGFPAQNDFKHPEEKMQRAAFQQRLMTLITALSDKEDLRIALTELFHLPAAQYDDKQWKILKALLTVLKIVAAQLRVTFQQHGQIDFIENAQAALAALGNDESPTDLALALDYQIQHILVDEFQDTSYSQYQLLEKLTAGWLPDDGRTLFVVGDPMQSIYRFREAEVGLFIRMCKKGIGHLHLTPLTLSVNFRSTANIVEWNNFHFQHIFPTFNDISSGAVSYSQSVAIDQPNNTLDHSTIEIKGFAEANPDIHSEKIITIVKETKEKYPHDKIAILVRSRTHLSAIIPALKKADIPYRAVEIDSLASRQCVLDVLSLTCAMLHPADRIAWLSILRAPWCGLTLADLHIIASNNPYAAIWDELNRPQIFSLLSEDGKTRINKLFYVLKSKLAERERTSLRYLIETTWLLLGGPACLQNYAEINDINAFFDLLDELSQNNQATDLDNLKNSVKALYASTQHDNDCVQLMTIHSAKGLEFDTVILPHLERKLPYDDKSLLLWMEQPVSNDQIALLLAPIHAIGNEKDSIYEYISRQQRIKSNYEIDRLFYVAATRAKKRLYLFFNAEMNSNNELKTETGSFLAKLWPFIEKQKETIFHTEQTENTEIQEKNVLAPRKINRLKITWQNPIQHAVFTTNSYQQQNGFQLSNETPKIIGTVIHHLLQYISQYGISWWQQQSNQQQEKYVLHQLLKKRIPAKQINTAIKTISTVIANALSDPKGQWILQQHQHAQSEYAITAKIDGFIHNLIIDRTFVDENGIRWIIDYKTTTFSHQDLDTFLANEQQKYLKKMHLYSQAIKLLEDKPIRLGLYFPALPAWHEWDE